jgi:hypothetical protein
MSIKSERLGDHPLLVVDVEPRWYLRRAVRNAVYKRSLIIFYHVRRGISCPCYRPHVSLVAIYPVAGWLAEERT